MPNVNAILALQVATALFASWIVLEIIVLIIAQGMVIATDTEHVMILASACVIRGLLGRIAICVSPHWEGLSAKKNTAGGMLLAAQMDVASATVPACAMTDILVQTVKFALFLFTATLVMSLATGNRAQAIRDAFRVVAASVWLAG